MGHRRTSGVVVVALLFVVASACAGDSALFRNVALLESLVRRALETGHRACQNYGSKDAWCLSLGDFDDPPRVLISRIADVTPRVLSLSDCRETRVIKFDRPQTIDPSVRIESLTLNADGSVAARVVVGCGATTFTAVPRGDSWEIRGGGWVGCGPVPSDCLRQ
jgi:hypothetical protein